MLIYLKGKKMRKPVFDKIALAVNVLMISIFIYGCGDTYNPNYSMGLIYSKENKADTNFVLFDENLEQVDEYKTSYPNVQYMGYDNATVENGDLYINPQGHWDKKDYGKIVKIDLNDGIEEFYDFGRVNIVDFSYKNEGLYATSNLNGICYIDYMDCKTKEISTIETTDVIITTIVAGDSVAYGVGMSFETDESCIYKLNFEEKKIELLYECQSESNPCYFVHNENQLYFIDDNKLIEYDLELGEYKSYELLHENAYNLLKKGNNIYIACTDIHNGGVSYVDIFDLEKKEVLNLLQCENEIMQMEITDLEDSIYILSLEELIQYKIEKGQAEEINRISVESEDTYFIGGFYLKEE